MNHTVIEVLQAKYSWGVFMLKVKASDIASPFWVRKSEIEKWADETDEDITIYDEKEFIV